VAAQLKKDLGIETDLVVGRSGEFTVWIGDDKIAEKTWKGFPSPESVVAAVRTRMANATAPAPPK
jgi:hypothetical protein